MASSSQKQDEPVTLDRVYLLRTSLGQNGRIPVADVAAHVALIVVDQHGRWYLLERGGHGQDPELKPVSIPKKITTHRSLITFREYQKLELEGQKWDKQPLGERVLPDRTLQGLNGLLKREAGMRYDAFGRNGTHCQLRADAWRKYLTGKEPQERLLTQLMRKALRRVPQEPGNLEGLFISGASSTIAAGKILQLAYVPLELVAHSSRAVATYDYTAFNTHLFSFASMESPPLTFPYVSPEVLSVSTRKASQLANIPLELLANSSRAVTAYDYAAFNIHAFSLAPMESPPLSFTYIHPGSDRGSAGSEYSHQIWRPRSPISGATEIELSDSGAKYVGSAQGSAPSFDTPRFTSTNDVPNSQAKFSTYAEGSRRPMHSSSNSRQAQTAQRLEQSARVHGPGLLGAAKNTYDCFADGDIFMGVWNTFALTWSTSMLCATGGYCTLVVEARKDGKGVYQPSLKFSICGLIDGNQG